MEEIACARADEGDVLVRYLGGRLSEPEVEAFERHGLECESCWEQIRAGAEIREARGHGVFAAPPSRGRGRRELGPLLAAAAALFVMILGVRQIAERPGVSTAEPVWRGEKAGTLPLEIRPGTADSIVLRWPAVPDASAYNVEIFSSDGQSVWHRETPETEATLAAGILIPPRPGISFFATVEALDSSGQPIARSRRERVPEP